MKSIREVPSEDIEGCKFERADGSLVTGAWRTVMRKDGLQRCAIVYGEMGLAMWGMGDRELVGWDENAESVAGFSAKRCAERFPTDGT